MALVVGIHALALQLALLGRFRAIEQQTGILNCFPRFGGELDVGVQCSRPAGQEPSLNLLVLSQSNLTDFFLGERILLQAAGEGVFGCMRRVRLGQEVRASERSSGDGMIEGFGLGFGAGRSGESSLRFGGSGCMREERDFVSNSAREVGKGFSDVGGIIVSFVRVLRAVRMRSMSAVSPEVTVDLRHSQE